MTDAIKLLDNGWQILLHRNGLGTYEALAVREGKSVNKALRSWRDHEPAADVEPKDIPFDGPNRYSAEGDTPLEAIHALAEKVLFRRLPHRISNEPI